MKTLKSLKRDRTLPLAYVLLTLFGVVMFYPFLFSLFGGITTRELYDQMIFLPRPVLSEIKNLLYFFRGDYFWNSLLLTLARFVFYSTFVLAVSILCGYLFTMYSFPLKRTAFALFMVSLMIPMVSTLVPSYILYSRFPFAGGNNWQGVNGTGFLDTAAMLFVTGWVQPYGIFLIMQSLKGIGKEYKEAAEIDGANFLQTVFVVYVPMLKAVLGVIIIGNFVGYWNDYLFPLVFMGNNQAVQPIGLYVVELLQVFGMQNPYAPPNYPVIFAICFVSMLPPAIVYLCMQDLFVAGITMGGVKG